jgi:predicted acyl esterase
MTQLTSAASQPVHEIVVEPHVKVQMRDGVRRDATIWRPTDPGRYPVILERMSYELMGRCTVNAEFFAKRGYVFVGQNTRGSYDSEGAYGWTESGRLGRAPRRVRQHRMGRNAGVVERQGGHVGRLVLGI